MKHRTFWGMTPLLCSAAFFTLQASAFAQATQEPKDKPAAQAPAAQPAQQEQKPAQADDKRSGETKSQTQAPSGTAATPKKEDTPRSAQQPADTKKSAQTPASDTKQSPAATTGQTTTQPKSSDTTTQSGTATKSTPSSSQPSTASSPSGSTTTQSGSTTTQSGSTTASQSGSTTASLTDQQRTSISTSISQSNAQPLRNVNFSVSVGTVIPSTVRFYPLTPAIVAVYPQYRGYSFVVVEEEIIIIEPRTRKIVQVVHYDRGGRAAVRSTLKLTDKQRNMIRTTIKRPTTTTTTTGSAVEKEIVIGDRLPETMVIERFPDTVYREVPAMRSYQYVVRDRGVYVVDPRERRVIDLID
jgi:hypothetical protein